MDMGSGHQSPTHRKQAIPLTTAQERATILLARRLLPSNPLAVADAAYYDDAEDDDPRIEQSFDTYFGIEDSDFF